MSKKKRDPNFSRKLLLRKMKHNSGVPISLKFEPTRKMIPGILERMKENMTEGLKQKAFMAQLNLLMQRETGEDYAEFIFFHSDFSVFEGSSVISDRIWFTGSLLTKKYLILSKDFSDKSQRRLMHLMRDYLMDCVTGGIGDKPALCTRLEYHTCFDLMCSFREDKKPTFERTAKYLQSEEYYEQCVARFA